MPDITMEHDYPSTPTTATAATVVADDDKYGPNEKDMAYVHQKADDEAEKAVEAADPPLPTPAPTAYGPAPDGGVAAWRAVAGLFFASFVQFGIANSYGVFQAYYETGPLKHYKADTISWIGATQQFILFFAVRRGAQQAVVTTLTSLLVHVRRTRIRRIRRTRHPPTRQRMPLPLAFHDQL